MRKALLVVNEFLKGKKYDEIHRLLISAFKERGIDLTMRTNAEVMTVLNGRLDSFCTYAFAVFFDKDIVLAKHLERCGLRLFNPAEVVAVCDDKRLTAVSLNGKIKMPDTVIAPMSYNNIGFSNFSFLDTVIERLGFPMIVKEAFGSFGQQVYLVHDRAELTEQLRKCSNQLLFQKFISSSYGRDVRVQVVGGRVIASMLRKGVEGSFISNITKGGTMEKWKADSAFEAMAIETCRLLGADFAGVDILFGKDGEPILCEVNSNAHFKNLLDTCGINFAQELAEYIGHIVSF